MAGIDEKQRGRPASARPRPQRCARARPRPASGQRPTFRSPATPAPRRSSPRRPSIWSDLHLADRSILLVRSRPFWSIEEMNSGAQVDCVSLITCHLVGVNRSSRPAKRPAKPGTPGRLAPLLHVHDDEHRRRPPEPRQRSSRQRIPILDRRRRLPVRQPPRRGARQHQRLLALVVRVVEHRDLDPLRRLARQERQRAARRRVYRARAVNNSSSIPRLSKDWSSLRFPPDSLHRRHEPTPSVQGSSAGPDPLTLLSSDAPRGAARRLPVRKWPICCLAATAYRISTASGKIDRHRRVRTAGRRGRTGHLVDLEQSRGPSAGQPTPHWTECVGGTGSPLVRERADQHVPPSVQPSHQRPRCPVPDTLGRWQSKTTRPTVTKQAGGAADIWRLLRSATPVTPRRAGCAARA